MWRQILDDDGKIVIVVTILPSSTACADSQGQGSRVAKKPLKGSVDCGFDVGVGGPDAASELALAAVEPGKGG